ncbi:MAG: phenylacetic acid degradation operon negative regulatory protein PaaX [Gammaproteobacteria bacterium]|jgi:phenylacetic acid degradation operon negative regulatory protein|nr:phenylacetic acid degradation operon negative regulatory protein PaaX [Gammaproteobacteria bacterium]MDH3846836.1 phenylacetic acid degradation operon negative regulatory protein PaaX [Gammaproteobacteria bacterium]MDH3907971.1 phenylacetic acid degradation operon negative regulatory protein PaaX [Gammaproteobacteria bacterium]MDH3953384.1 phenylacetic acid degradation operon negative regulatory protein PaaX [Gammaproteobacteria bacterium]MDH4003713.1 phenylacetic acid degradation operon neg
MDAACNQIVKEFRSRPTLRAGSLITTVFGDSIAPRGGTVWLGSLIRAMAEFGISERLVRTSVYRLVKDGWLQSAQVGRRSFYSLTDEGRGKFRAATHRIYGEPVTDWDGEWCLLLLSNLEAPMKESLRRECGWLGFGPLSANVLAHPSPDESDLDVTLKRVGAAGDVVIMSGRTMRSDAAMRTLVRSAWNLDDIDTRYENFVTMFRPLYAALKKSHKVEPRIAFVTRTLLIQEYRKVLLRDPQLPHDLLPAGWRGTAAYQLSRNLYRGLHKAADDYLSEVMETADGPLPPPAGDYMQRFGGLVDAGTAQRKTA